MAGVDRELSLEEAAAALRAGQVVAFPTETFFGLAALPSSSIAIEELCRLKSRSLGEGIPLILSGADVYAGWLGDETADVRAYREQLERRFWPGPLTLVVAPSQAWKAETDPRVMGPSESVAVRVSSLRSARALAAAVGGAITATSANPHGEPPPKSVADVRRLLPDVAIFAPEPCGDAVAPSTIIDVRSRPAKVLREGAINCAQIESAE